MDQNSRRPPVLPLRITACPGDRSISQLGHIGQRLRDGFQETRAIGGSERHRHGDDDLDLSVTEREG
jgi:hypothetical protein